MAKLEIYIQDFKKIKNFSLEVCSQTLRSKDIDVLSYTEMNNIDII